jgi:hypothetical protein
VMGEYCFGLSLWFFVTLKTTIYHCDFLLFSA